VLLPKVRFLDTGSVANVQGIGSVARVRLGRKLGRLSEAAMDQIKRAIRWALEMDENTP
jgi:mRNA interferase MazF